MTAPEPVPPQVLKDTIPGEASEIVIKPSFGGRFQVKFLDAAGRSMPVSGTFVYVKINGDGTIEYGTE